MYCKARALKSDTWPSLPAQASANCYLDKHIASTSSESKYYIALMQKSDVRNRVDVADVGLHSQHRLVLIACIDQHIASTEGGNTTISNSWEKVLVKIGMLLEIFLYQHRLVLIS